MQNMPLHSFKLLFNQPLINEHLSPSQLFFSVSSCSEHFCTFTFALLSVYFLFHLNLKVLLAWNMIQVFCSLNDVAVNTYDVNDLSLPGCSGSLLLPLVFFYEEVSGVRWAHKTSFNK